MMHNKIINTDENNNLGLYSGKSFPLLRCIRDYLIGLSSEAAARFINRMPETSFELATLFSFLPPDKAFAIINSGGIDVGNAANILDVMWKKYPQNLIDILNCYEPGTDIKNIIGILRKMELSTIFEILKMVNPELEQKLTKSIQEDKARI